MKEALYRKYRPKNLEELCGQGIVNTILTNSTDNGNFNHAYLFFGPRGTGKTSAARLLARLVNCEKPNKGKCCEKCDNCLISKDNSCPDIIELDAASNNGIDEIRDIKAKVDLVPSSLNYKVYIIDEIQMLTKEAFNALLKTLEEPPAHVIFIMATTEIKKVPDTIVSRCQMLEFKRIKLDDITSRISEIASKEKMKIDDKAARKIARYANGGMRDAIGILEKAISYSDDNKITENTIDLIMDGYSEEEIKNFSNVLIDGNTKDLIDTLDKFKEESRDSVILLEELIEYLGSDKGLIVNNTKLILELNDIINYIKLTNLKEIYLKTRLLSYIKENEERIQEIKEKISSNVSRETLEESKENISREIINEEKPKMTEEIKKLRINNCLAEASKEDKETSSKKLKDLKGKSKYIKDIIKTEVAASSKEYMILVSKQKSFVALANEELTEYEKELEKEGIISKLIFLDNDNWDKVREEYVQNFKKGIKPTYIEEELKDVTITDLLKDIIEVE